MTLVRTPIWSLLDKIRNLSSEGRLADAQKVATTALENLNESEQNEFYLRQIMEETKLYFKLANQAMLEKQYSQARPRLQQGIVKMSPRSWRTGN